MGTLVCRVRWISAAISSNGMVASSEKTCERGVMMSRTVVSPKSKIWSMYWASLSSNSPSPTACLVSERTMSSVTMLAAERSLPTARVMK